MPKIMNINCSCAGSTGKIIHDIANHTVPLGYQHILCAPDAPGNSENIRYYKTSLPYEQGIYRRLNFLYGFQYGLAPLSTAKIINLINREKPDLIHIHCANGFMVNMYALLRHIKKSEIPVVFTNHAEFYYTGNCPYAYECEKWLIGCGACPQKARATGGRLQDTSARSWKKMKRALNGLENAAMASVSPWVWDRAKRSPLTQHLPHDVVLNGINTSVFTYRNKTELREKYALPQSGKILFHPTSSFSARKEDIKGGSFVLELAERLAKQNVTVVVAAGSQAQDIAIPENMILLGHVTDQVQLAEYYALADVTVIASRRETFSMPVAESLCCGTPVVGFLAGGPESIAMEPYCRFVPYGDMDGLCDAMEACLCCEYDKNEISQLAKQKYDASVMADGYRSIYERLLTDRSS